MLSYPPKRTQTKTLTNTLTKTLTKTNKMSYIKALNTGYLKFRGGQPLDNKDVIEVNGIKLYHVPQPQPLQLPQPARRSIHPSYSHQGATSISDGVSCRIDQRLMQQKGR